MLIILDVQYSDSKILLFRAWSLHSYSLSPISLIPHTCLLSENHQFFLYI